MPRITHNPEDARTTFERVARELDQIEAGENSRQNENFDALPDDCIGIDLLESSVPWSPHAISKIDAALPKLFETLTAALRNPPFQNEPV